MAFDDLVNWAFAYVLVGSVIWMLMWPCRPRPSSRYGLLIASVGIVVLWPYVAAAIIGGLFTREPR